MVGVLQSKKEGVLIGLLWTFALVFLGWLFFKIAERM
jgi:hypothetical protein